MLEPEFGVSDSLNHLSAVTVGASGGAAALFAAGFTAAWKRSSQGP